MALTSRRTQPHRHRQSPLSLRTSPPGPIKPMSGTSADVHSAEWPLIRDSNAARRLLRRTTNRAPAPHHQPSYLYGTGTGSVPAAPPDGSAHWRPRPLPPARRTDGRRRAWRQGPARGTASRRRSGSPPGGHTRSSRPPSTSEPTWRAAVTRRSRTRRRRTCPRVRADGVRADAADRGTVRGRSTPAPRFPVRSGRPDRDDGVGLVGGRLISAQSASPVRTGDAGRHLRVPRHGCGGDGGAAGRAGACRVRCGRVGCGRGGRRGTRGPRVPA